jgi:hypothetical protein
LVGGFPVDLVGDGPAYRQVKGVGREQRVVLVGQWFSVGEFRSQDVAGLKGVGEGVEAQYVFLDPTRFHRQGPGVPVVGVALRRAGVVEFAVFSANAGDLLRVLPLARRSDEGLHGTR